MYSYKDPARKLKANPAIAGDDVICDRNQIKSGAPKPKPKEAPSGEPAGGWADGFMS
jgi:hypothetical protein